jgi:multiple sugar transport system permease protein
VIPASFLAIPFYRIMQIYGLSNNLWSVIAAEVTFATAYAIFIFQRYAVSIPMELDEAARIDGASPFQVYCKIYLPLMAPALVAVGTYALPPVVIYYTFRRRMAAGLTSGGVKG